MLRRYPSADDIDRALDDYEPGGPCPLECDDGVLFVSPSGNPIDPASDEFDCPICTRGNITMERPLNEREKMLEFMAQIAELADAASDEPEPAEMRSARLDLVKIATRLGDILGSEQRKAG